MRLTATFLLWLLAAGAQDTVTFQSSSQLVVETVVVKDKSGNPVEGLTAKDFTVTEDGTPQTIKFFEFQRLPDAPYTTAPGLNNRAAPQARAFDKLPRVQISPEPPGTTKYRDRRLLALYFD